VRGRWVGVTALVWGTAALAQGGRGVERLALTLQGAVPCQVPALGVGDGVRAHLWVAGLFTLHASALLVAMQMGAWQGPASSSESLKDPAEPLKDPSGSFKNPAEPLKDPTDPFKNFSDPVKGPSEPDRVGGTRAWALVRGLGSVGISVATVEGYPRL